jgi:hypothetical protein
MKYFTESDRENEDFSEPVKEGKRPIGFQAFPCTIMAPIDVYNGKWLDTNPQKWELQGGIYKTGKIHPSRVHVFMSRRTPNRWRGLSVFEPIWIPLMSYFQAQIYMLRAFAELGNVIPMWLIDSPNDINDLWTDRSNLLDEMKMNGKFIGIKGDEFVFANTKIGQGLNELMEIWKEDIAAGSNLPVPIIWGRVTAAGLSGAAYLMAERYYWNEIANIQSSFSDDVIRIIRDAGFKSIDNKKRIDWNLAITKTDQQRLLDEGMQIQNEILKEELIQRRLQTTQMIDLYKQGQPINGEQMNLNENEEKPKQESKQAQQKKDFVIEEILKSRREIHEYLWGARKVA